LITAAVQGEQRLNNSQQQPFPNAVLCVIVGKVSTQTATK